MIGPSRPRNIRATSTSCPAIGRSSVIPVDSPTVANADTVSNSTASSPKGVISSSATVATITSPTPASATVRAWRWMAAGSRRPSTCTVGSPRISASITNASSANVVTLIPPAVPALPPPMNISTSVISRVDRVGLAHVDAVEAGGAGLDPVEHTDHDLAADIDRADGARVVPLAEQERRDADHEQDRVGDHGDPHVQRPPRRAAAAAGGRPRTTPGSRARPRSWRARAAGRSTGRWRRTSCCR